MLPKSRIRSARLDSDRCHSAGHVLSARLGALRAQPFDPERAQLSGSAFPLNEPLASRVFLGGILNDFSANAAGMLVYPRHEYR